MFIIMAVMGILLYGDRMSELFVMTRDYLFKIVKKYKKKDSDNI